MLGFDHAELGARILEKWGFPDTIIRAVKRHHEPAAEDDTEIDDVVRISDNIALLMGFGTSVDGLAYPGFDVIYRKYAISQETLDKIMGDSLEKILEVKSEYDISTEDK